MSSTKYLKYKIKYLEQKGGVYYRDGYYLFFIPEKIYNDNIAMIVDCDNTEIFRDMIPNSKCISNFDTFTNNIGDKSFFARITDAKYSKDDGRYKNYKTINSNNKVLSFNFSKSYLLDYKNIVDNIAFNISVQENHDKLMSKIKEYLNILNLYEKSNENYRVLYIKYDRSRNNPVYIKNNYIFTYNTETNKYDSPVFSDEYITMPTSIERKYYGSE